MSKVKEPGVIYRVSLDSAKGGINVMTVGLVGVETTDPMEGDYGRLGELPMWVQEKLAMLMMLTSPGGPVEGIGKRIDRNTFWVYP